MKNLFIYYLIAIIIAIIIGLLLVKLIWESNLPGWLKVFLIAR